MTVGWRGKGGEKRLGRDIVFFLSCSWGKRRGGCPRGWEWMEILTVDGCDKEKERARE